MSNEDNKVVDLETRRARSPEIQRVRTEETPSERAARAHVIRENISGTGFRPGENVVAAEALYGLLEDLHQRSGKTISALLHAAGIGEPQTASRYLSQYAIRKGGNESRLRKKPRAYADIAERTAKHVGSSSDEALLRVFGATSIAQPPSKAMSSEAGAYADLTERINRIADDVAKRHNLKDFFRDVHRAQVHFGFWENPLGDPLSGPLGLSVVYSSSFDSSFRPFRVTFGRPDSPGAGTILGAWSQPCFPMLPLVCVMKPDEIIPTAHTSDS